MDYTEILYQILKVEIYKEEATKEYSKDEELTKLTTEIMKECVYYNYSPSIVKNLLKESTLEQQQKRNFLQFWVSEKESIHNFIIKKSLFCNKLSNIRWRIDQLTTEKEITQENEIVSVVELTKKNEKQKETKIIFEVDKTTIKNVLEKFQQIQQKVDMLTS